MLPCSTEIIHTWLIRQHLTAQYTRNVLIHCNCFYKGAVKQKRDVYRICGNDVCHVGDGSDVGNGCSGRGQSFRVPFPFSQMSTGFPMTQI